MSAKLMDSIMQKAFDKRIPLHCQFNLTFRCNLNCIHCYAVNQNRDELKTSEIKKILDQLADAGVLNVDFSGGEILLREDFLEIARYARKLHFDISLVTNGTLFDQETVNELASLNVRNISISIYSMNPDIHDKITNVPGSHQKTVETAQMLIEKNMKIKINNVVMKQNKNEYPLVHEFAKSIGAECQINYQLWPKINGDTSTLKEEINVEDLIKLQQDKIFDSTNEIIHQSSNTFNQEFKVTDLNVNHEPNFGKGILCQAANTFFSISPYGDISPCTLFPLLCGNLKDKSFKEIWYHSSEMLKISKLRFSQLSLCSVCDLKNYCNYCPGLSYLEEGNYLVPPERKCLDAIIIKEKGVDL